MKKLVTTSRIRQGGSFGPILVNIVIKETIETVKVSTPGYHLKRHQRNILCYSDDADLISEIEDGLQYRTRKLTVFDAIISRIYII